ncbi:sigma factor [Frankia tisae]|uniref:sigma factor n=1 Tax=Frankia tisae TaxID=2950104 RepID=UPI0027E23C9B|nr:sigma factor [Frankia tisae]
MSDEAERAHLRAVAYRLLGSFADAEDVVQEAWLRLGRVDADRIEDLRAWLTVVVSRLCLDQLRSARGRREGYVGPWLPEPFVDGLAGRDGIGGGADAGSPVVGAAFVAASPTPSSPRPPARTSTGCWPCSIRTPSSAPTAGDSRRPPGGRC